MWPNFSYNDQDTWKETIWTGIFFFSICGRTAGLIMNPVIWKHITQPLQRGDKQPSCLTSAAKLGFRADAFFHLLMGRERLFNGSPSGADVECDYAIIQELSRCCKQSHVEAWTNPGEGAENQAFLFLFRSADQVPTDHQRSLTVEAQPHRGRWSASGSKPSLYIPRIPNWLHIWESRIWKDSDVRSSKLLVQTGPKDF